MSMSFAMDIFFIIYICQYSELILLLTEKLFLYRLIYILTEYFDMKKEQTLWDIFKEIDYKIEYICLAVGCL